MLARRYGKTAVIIAVVLSLSAAGCLQAAGPDTVGKCYFYRGLTYGSEANYNPVSLVMNASFDILQITNRNNQLAKLQFHNGITNVNWNLRHARSVIRQYGWQRFLETEIFPASFKIGNAQYWPNYKLHLIGGGMTYIAMAEWYALHQVPYPRVCSLGTVMLMHYINEVVENNKYRGPNEDPLADLLIFDPAGILLFSIPAVPRFFSGKLHMADWSFQPIYDFRQGTLINNGEKFTFKFPVPGLDKWSVFYLTGTEGMMGMSYQHTASDCITAGGGYAVRRLEEVDNHTGVRTLTATLIMTGGVFYDRHNSLLASLILGGPRGYLARLNIYPGVITIRGFSPGLAFLLQEDRKLACGVYIHYLPLGPGISF